VASDIEACQEVDVDGLARHWPEYLMEAAELGAFMLAAAASAAILDHPASPVRQAIEDPFVRRLIGGRLMGATAICQVRSPWGRQSGAHMNPSLTLTFLRLGKIAPGDAAFYVAAQFAGGAAGIALAALLIGPALGIPEVSYVATRPGPAGPLVAFGAELAISFVLMIAVLTLSNDARLAKLTPFVVGLLVATYITIEAPLSGMSMNPARTFGPALVARIWDSLWVYFLAPPIGMLLAAEVYVRIRGAHAVRCAKLHHHNDARCIFRCAYPA
jgi:aquaporin Z